MTYSYLWYGIQDSRRGVPQPLALSIWKESTNKWRFQYRIIIYKSWTSNCRFQEGRSRKTDSCCAYIGYILTHGVLSLELSASQLVEGTCQKKRPCAQQEEPWRPVNVPLNPKSCFHISMYLYVLYWDTLSSCAAICVVQFLSGTNTDEYYQTPRSCCSFNVNVWRKRMKASFLVKQ